MPDRPLFMDENPPDDIEQLRELRNRLEQRDALIDERSRASTTAVTANDSPELAERDQKEKMREVANNEYLLRQADRRIAKEKALEVAVTRRKKAEDAARKGNIREMRMLAKESGA